MKKISKIDNCLHCPLKQRAGTYNGTTYEFVCGHPAKYGTKIEAILTIPAWCPLEDDNE